MQQSAMAAPSQQREHIGCVEIQLSKQWSRFHNGYRSRWIWANATKSLFFFNAGSVKTVAVLVTLAHPSVLVLTDAESERASFSLVTTRLPWMES